MVKPGSDPCSPSPQHHSECAADPLSAYEAAPRELFEAQRLMRGRTTFMIAHRLSTLEKCDLLIRVEAGRVSVVPRVEPEVSVPLEGALA